MNIPLATIAGLMALIGSIVAPTIWLSQIKEVNALQDQSISVMQENYKELKADNKILSNKIDALLWKNNIDPSKVR